VVRSHVRPLPICRDFLRELLPTLRFHPTPIQQQDRGVRANPSISERFARIGRLRRGECGSEFVSLDVKLRRRDDDVDVTLEEL
jgi:hypothetical protein